VRVAIATPEGVPVNVTLAGKTQHVAAKPPAGTVTVVTLTVPSGTYHVHFPSVTFEGTRYVGRGTSLKIRVRPDRTKTILIVYDADGAARELHATAVSQTSLTLAWTAPEGSRFSLRRTLGSNPATRRWQGVKVRTVGRTAVDTGLQPGTQYSYSLFTRRRHHWIGPLVIVAGTAPPSGSTDASYIASPTTLLPKASDIASVATTGSGVQLVLQNNVHTPPLGAGVVLPISEALPGGFLGVVTSVSEDGRTIGLEAGGLSDAFDYYELSVPDFHGGDPAPPTTAALARGGHPATSSTSGPLTPADRNRLADASGAASLSSRVPHAATAPKTAGAPANALISCLGGSGAKEISFDPSLSLGGHFHATITKYKIFGKDVPTGATLDMAVAATASGIATVTTSGNLSCNAPLVPVLVPIAQAPVPISFYFNPTAQFTVNGSVEVNNLGLTVTAGVKVSGHFGLTDGASFSGSPILSAVPTAPKVVKNGSIGFKVGGQVIIGPGAGTPKAGVIAGLGGELNPIDASFGFVFPKDDPRFNACLKASAAFTRSLYLIAKAWVGNWDLTKSITLDALKGSNDYPGSPWYHPAGCKDAVNPGDTVLGGGVTKIDDNVSGGQNQWGYLPGLVPGKKTWVLSTGDIAKVGGVPSDFASSPLGGPGDNDLSALAGRPTSDAVAYTVTLVPTGSTLHVRYVFASEEYPEYVGSQFNDVMAVYVNGVNCATVPGTTTPVSVNTVNMQQNAQYFVDNTTGAAGYSTSMDGLTVPLECKVPVQIGKPVTVKITVADASDQIYDSAVALLDQGIWAD
jgi:chitodextrinase